MKQTILAALLVVIAACGDNLRPEAETDAALGGADATPADAMLPSATAYAVGTDFATSGVFSRVDIPALSVTQDVVSGVASTDPVLRYHDGRLYIINRFGADNISILDVATGDFLGQISTGGGTNPQDVAVKGDKIYVAALASGEVIIMDTSGITGTIDISSYDVDGVPDATSLYLVGDTLLVTAGLLDGTFTSNGGKVIVIDTTTDTVTGDFDLVYNNPVGLLQPFGADELIVTTTETFAAGPGCVERITVTGTPASAGCLVENTALGGYAGVYHGDGDRVWLAVSTSFTEAKLVSVDSSGTLDDVSLTPATVQPTDLGVCPTGHLVVGDAAGGGLRVYDAAGEERTTEPLDIGQPPAFANGIVCL